MFSQISGKGLVGDFLPHYIVRYTNLPTDIAGERFSKGL